MVVLRDAAAHPVVGHHDVGGAAYPENWAVFAVVGDLPSARRGFDERLVAVGIEERRDAIVAVFGARQVSGIVVGVGRDDASCPGSGCEFAIGRIGVGRTFAVGVNLVGHATRRFVIEPARRVTCLRGVGDNAPYRRVALLRGVGDNAPWYTFSHPSVGKSGGGPSRPH